MVAQPPKPSVSVMWGICCYGAMKHASIITLSDMIHDYSRYSEYGYRMIFMSDALICSARTRVVEEAIKADMKYILFLDADMTFPASGARALVAHAEKLNLDMLSGLYCMRRPPHYPLFYADMNLRHGSTPLFPEAYKGMPIEIDAAGLGICLLRTGVFKKVPKPWFVLDPSISASEDIPFFANAKKCGFKLWGDPTVVCGHIGDPQIVMPTADAPCTNPFTATIIDAKEYCRANVGVADYTPGEKKETEDVKETIREGTEPVRAGPVREAARDKEVQPVRLEDPNPQAGTGASTDGRPARRIWHRSG